MHTFRRNRLYFLGELGFRSSPRERARRTVERRWQEQNRVVDLLVRGASMGNVISDGERVSVRFSEHPCVDQNQLVYIRNGERRIVHRVLFRLGPIFVEHGIANDYRGIHWTSSAIGNVVSVERRKAGV